MSVKPSMGLNAAVYTPIWPSNVTNSNWNTLICIKACLWIARERETGRQRGIGREKLERYPTSTAPTATHVRVKSELFLVRVHGN